MAKDTTWRDAAREAINAGSMAIDVAAPEPVTKTMVKRPMTEEQRRAMQQALGAAGVAADLAAPQPVSPLPKQTMVRRYTAEEEARRLQAANAKDTSTTAKEKPKEPRKPFGPQP